MPDADRPAPLSPDARDVVLRWLVAGMMKGTVNTEGEQAAFQFVTTGRAERLFIDAERAARDGGVIAAERERAGIYEVPCCYSLHEFEQVCPRTGRKFRDA